MKVHHHRHTGHGTFQVAAHQNGGTSGGSAGPAGGAAAAAAHSCEAASCIVARPFSDPPVPRFSSPVACEGKQTHRAETTLACTQKWPCAHAHLGRPNHLLRCMRCR